MIEKFKEEGIIREGHFLLTSGRHSNLYIDKDMMFRSKLFPTVVAKMAYLCGKFLDLSKVNVVTGPAVAGAVLASPIAYEMRRVPHGGNIRFVYPEKIDGMMVFRRGYDKFLRGKNVLIIEDIITTGKSVTQTASAIHDCDGTVEAVAAVWNRTNWSNPYFPVISLINERVGSYDPEDCRICKETDSPLVNPKD